jgi:hypothetical protein
MIVYTRLKNKLNLYYYLQIFREGAGFSVWLTIEDEDDCYHVIKQTKK